VLRDVIGVHASTQPGIRMLANTNTRSS
jgi:hypothetical protein